jgi:hypothetical protein
MRRSVLSFAEELNRTKSMVLWSENERQSHEINGGSIQVCHCLVLPIDAKPTVAY